jgi:hypothetical protein
MPVFSCSGPGCQRLISVSAIPGGNPTALAEPERFAVVHQRCSSCGQRFCDRCMEKDEKLKHGECASCGARLAEPPKDEAMKIMTGEQPADDAVAAAQIEAGDKKKKWWKLW